MAHRRSCGLFQNGDGKDAPGSRIRTYPFETDHTIYICMYSSKIREQIDRSRRKTMSRKASQFQKKVMSLGYRGKEIFKPLNTGWIDDHTACIREWIANIFFYRVQYADLLADA